MAPSPAQAGVPASRQAPVKAGSPGLSTELRTFGPDCMPGRGSGRAEAVAGPSGGDLRVGRKGPLGPSASALGGRWLSPGGALSAGRPG